MHPVGFGCVRKLVCDLESEPPAGTPEPSTSFADEDQRSLSLLSLSLSLSLSLARSLALSLSGVYVYCALYVVPKAGFAALATQELPSLL
jgi:hypothetical protein